jgi:hypothetical protein
MLGIRLVHCRVAGINLLTAIFCDLSFVALFKKVHYRTPSKNRYQITAWLA